MSRRVKESTSHITRSEVASVQKLLEVLSSNRKKEAGKSRKIYLSP